MILMRENAPALLATLMCTGLCLSGAATNPAHVPNGVGKHPRSAECLRAGKKRFPIS
jgi:hypothetical protein